MQVTIEEANQELASFMTEPGVLGHPERPVRRIIRLPQTEPPANSVNSELRNYSAHVLDTES